MLVFTGLYVSSVEGLQPKSMVRQLFFLCFSFVFSFIFLILSFISFYLLSFFYISIQRDLWLDLNQG